MMRKLFRKLPTSKLVRCLIVLCFLAVTTRVTRGSNDLEPEGRALPGFDLIPDVGEGSPRALQTESDYILRNYIVNLALASNTQDVIEVEIIYEIEVVKILLIFFSQQVFDVRFGTVDEASFKSFINGVEEPVSTLTRVEDAAPFMIASFPPVSGITGEVISFKFKFTVQGLICICKVLVIILCDYLHHVLIVDGNQAVIGSWIANLPAFGKVPRFFEVVYQYVPPIPIPLALALALPASLTFHDCYSRVPFNEGSNEGFTLIPESAATALNNADQGTRTVFAPYPTSGFVFNVGATLTEVFFIPNSPLLRKAFDPIF